MNTIRITKREFHRKIEEYYRRESLDTAKEKIAKELGLTWENEQDEGSKDNDYYNSLLRECEGKENLPIDVRSEGDDVCIDESRNIDSTETAEDFCKRVFGSLRNFL